MIRISVFERIGPDRELIAVLIQNDYFRTVHPIVLPASALRPNANAPTTLDIVTELVADEPHEPLVADETHEPEPIDVEQGVKIHASSTARYPVSLLVREGCSGSPYCAAEIYTCEGDNYVGAGAVDAHLSDDELERLYQAVKAVRKARRKRIAGVIGDVLINRRKRDR